MNEFQQDEINQKDCCFKDDYLNLGDLAPIIYLHSKYKNMSESEKRSFHQKYEMTEAEVHSSFAKTKEIEE